MAASYVLELTEKILPGRDGAAEALHFTAGIYGSAGKAGKKAGNAGYGLCGQISGHAGKYA